MAPPTPFGLIARAEHKSVEPGKSKLWAAVRLDPKGKAMEAERAPLAVVLVVDTSGSMQGDPIRHVLSACEILADLLDARDQLAIVTFSDQAGVRCGLTAVTPTGCAAIKSTLWGVRAGGNTNIHGGMEVAAGILMTAPAGLRRTMVVMSDGQPNLGIATADGLAGYVRSLRLAVSTLGFGLRHDENVLDAIATAGSGRYAYIPDPALARTDLARAALAHGGIVADQVEMRVKLEDGVELLSVLPATPLRMGGSGVACTLGDVFVDEGRLIALELALDLKPSSRGRLAIVTITGRSPDGATHEVEQVIAVDVRAGTPVVDLDAQRDVVMMQAEAARLAARAQADREIYPMAAALLQVVVDRILALPSFVRNDGSPIAELLEQLVDEAANYTRVSTSEERGHQRKASTSYKSQTPSLAAPSPRKARVLPAIHAKLIGMNHAVINQRLTLYVENTVGRSSTANFQVDHGSLSRLHARINFVIDHYVVQDMGATNGTLVNGKHVTSAVLADGDEVRFGDVAFRFELDK